MATRAFDSAMVLFPADERRRLDRIERLLTPRDSARIAAQTDVNREVMSRRYWMSVDKLWSVERARPRMEFLARVAYAELRWSVDELGLRGSESDRGQVYIRYGPPDVIIGLSPSPSQGITGTTNFWAYNFGLLFAFQGAPTFGTMRFPADDRSYANGITASTPVMWKNIDDITIDSLPIRVSRFRAAADSVDLVVAARAPVDSIQRSAAAATAVHSHVWLLDRGVFTTAHDSAVALRTSANIVSRRVAAGWYTLRAEASAPGAQYAASTSAQIIARADSATGFATSGFGMSDLMLASRVAEQRAQRRSWRDVDATPLAGVHARGTPLGLVWEAYDLAEREGQARYEVAVTVERARGRAGRVVAEILDRLASVIQVDQSDDRATVRFERVVPFSRTLVEGIPVGLGDTPAGTYRVTVAITDRVSGRVTSRTVSVEIRD
jgi:GWxTD domain-containing protein